jgi:hypothetical protein
VGLADRPLRFQHLACSFEGQSIRHGNSFLAKNVATQEMEYIRLKAGGMYLYMLPSDGVYVQRPTRRHHWSGDLVRKWNDTATEH